MVFRFQNIPKYLDPSYKMDLDLRDCFGRETPRLTTKEISRTLLVILDPNSLIIFKLQTYMHDKGVDVLLRICQLQFYFCVFNINGTHKRTGSFV